MEISLKTAVEERERVHGQLLSLLATPNDLLDEYAARLSSYKELHGRKPLIMKIGPLARGRLIQHGKDLVAMGYDRDPYDNLGKLFGVTVEPELMKSNFEFY